MSTQQLAESCGDSLPVAGLAVLEFAKTLHQIEELAVNLDRVNCHAAIEPLASMSGISGAPLPKGGRFLDGHSSRSCLEIPLMQPAPDLR